MGLFNFFKRREKEKWVEVYSPLNGKVIALEEVPDEAFSKKMIGDGCAIDPVEGAIYAPVDGEITIFETNHATSFETNDGLEIIVHFGIDTVSLCGQGFKRIAEDGKKVKKGDKLVEYDLEFIKNKVPSVKTPVIINNKDIVEQIDIIAKGKEVKAGELLMKIKIK
ncbi:PTS glucose transporter subunit IIA [uncultured Fusobacterium sp.]|jgi:PTS system glucose-specific IIA component|uniref:PTS sugar transporter subunit IIA n=1 Tax=uncultured Fusobacterium sp. TaxID=159267 RepID=UPI0025CF0637|nr:PTS glucose transporter subunit IIA [uncultured Fusobacterium sp.]MCF2638812.1 PTS glucose transporter subunit IIA [Fusobacterium varium]